MQPIPYGFKTSQYCVCVCVCMWGGVKFGCHQNLLHQCEMYVDVGEPHLQQLLQPEVSKVV
jgi:hypothetical protein